MDYQEKKDKINSLVSEILKFSYDEMVKKIDKVLNSGAISIDDWNPDVSPMILPKCIVNAILKDESVQYEGRGTSHEKRIKKEVKNIMYYI
jgi:hypothetical protein